MYLLHLRIVLSFAPMTFRITSDAGGKQLEVMLCDSGQQRHCMTDKSASSTRPLMHGVSTGRSTMQ